jgi:hypothetical protein
MNRSIILDALSILVRDQFEFLPAESAIRFNGRYAVVVSIMLCFRHSLQVSRAIVSFSFVVVMYAFW